MVIRSGERKLIAAASAIGIWRTPNTNSTEDPVTASPRSSCSFGLRGRSTPQGVRRARTAAIAKKTTYLIHAISMIGMDTLRYLAIESAVANTTVAPTDSAIPRIGSSV